MAENVAADWQQKVVHATFKGPGFEFMASDKPPDSARAAGSNIALSLNSQTEAEADHAFAKLSAGGEVTMPLAQSFWNAKFGMLTDKFGIEWMISWRPPAA